MQKLKRMSIWKLVFYFKYTDECFVRKYIFEKYLKIRIWVLYLCIFAQVLYKTGGRPFYI